LEAKSAWKGFFSIALFILLASLTIGFYTSRSFRVKEIKSNIALQVNLKNAIERYALNKQLFSVDIEKIYNYIIKNHPEYKEVYISREFPSCLKIEINLRTPFAQIKAKRFYLIAKDGVVISDGSPDAFGGFIPIEISNVNIILPRGSLVKDKRLKLAFDLIGKLRNSSFFKKIPLSLINVASPEVAYFIIQDTKIIIGANELDKKLNILEQVIKEQLQNNISGAEYIDLRYEKVYLGIKR
jgi:cell division septal protein FtsQ